MQGNREPLHIPLHPGKTVKLRSLSLCCVVPLCSVVPVCWGTSVRLRLTLSYAGFLVVAGTLLLATVWVFLLRYVPDQEAFQRPGAPVPFSPTRSDLLDAFAPKAGLMLAFLLVFGLLGMVIAGISVVRQP